MVENEVSQSKSWWGSSQAGEQELKVVAEPELEDANVHDEFRISRLAFLF